VPIALVLRQYRREVCGWCFAYERGQNLRTRDALTGFAFCGDACLANWKADVGDACDAAWGAVEDFVRRKSGVRRTGSGVMDVGDVDADGDIVLVDVSQRPGREEIEVAWAMVESTAHFIRQARAGSTAKPHRRAVSAVLDVSPHPDTLYLLLAGVLAHWRSDNSELDMSEDPPASDEDDSDVVDEQGVWAAFLSLTPDSMPYNSTQHLNDHIHAYLHLLALLPTPLLTSVTPIICLAIIKRDSHNSFGIRSLDDDGDEFFGYGVWPAASYFNHGCEPNVSKQRVGRRWEFWTQRAVKVGDDLEISYLGGEEVDMDMMERRERLKKTWGFVCACRKCVTDQGT
jgi:SET and MYND domain-containing protein